VAEIEAQGERILGAGLKPNLWVGMTHVALALAALTRGDPGRAEEAARQGVATMAVAPTGQPLGFATLSQILREQGRLAEARTVAEQGIAALQAVGGACFMDVRAYLALAEAQRAMGARLEARAVLLEAERRIERRAARIPDGAMRERFIGAVRDHVRVHELLADG
jgi:ATP/maltotriose-dependent transcriptional regulator MalT